VERAGLKNSTADPRLFYCTHDDNFLYVAIYADDGFVAGNRDEEIEVFLELFQEVLISQFAHLRTFLECSSSGKAVGLSL
jgi:hypothetical protein